MGKPSFFTEASSVVLDAPTRKTLQKWFDEMLAFVSNQTMRTTSLEQILINMQTDINNLQTRVTDLETENATQQQMLNRIDTWVLQLPMGLATNY